MNWLRSIFPLFAFLPFPLHAVEEGIPASLRELSGNYKRMTPLRSPRNPSLVALNCENEIEWTGELKVVHRTGDHIDWEAKLPKYYLDNRACYILSFRWVRASPTGSPLLEVYTSTHMGNGQIWLFAIEGRRLRVLMNAVAVDRHHEHMVPEDHPGKPTSSVLRGGKLTMHYPPRFAGKRLILKGIDDLLDDNDILISSTPIHRTFRWDRRQKVYREDRTGR